MGRSARRFVMFAAVSIVFLPIPLVRWGRTDASWVDFKVSVLFQPATPFFPLSSWKETFTHRKSDRTRRLRLLLLPSTFK